MKLLLGVIVIFGILSIVNADCSLYSLSGLEIGTIPSNSTNYNYCCAESTTFLGTFCTECCTVYLVPLYVILIIFILCCCCGIGGCCICVFCLVRGSNKNSEIYSHSVNTSYPQYTNPPLYPNLNNPPPYNPQYYQQPMNQHY